MASADADTTLTKPLLGDHETDLTTSSRSSSKSRSGVSLRTLEDGGEEPVTFRLNRRQGRWERLLMAIRKRQNGTSRDEGKSDIKIKSFRDGRRVESKSFGKRSIWVRALLGLPVAVVLFFGLVHILNVLLSYSNLFQDDTQLLPATRFDVGSEVNLDDLTKDVTPIHCHSHNDYWRRVPLYDALRWGCTGVEADVWLFDNELLVGHNTNALTKNRTFRSMYVDPLVRILDHQNAVNENLTSASPMAVKNGVYEVDPAQTLVLLVDFKNDGHAIYPFVSDQLAAFREKGYLSYFDGKATITGPITVVATGNAPFDLITADSSYRDIFFDAPLDRLYEEPVSYSKDVGSNIKPRRNSSPIKRVSGGQGTVGTTPDSSFDITNSYYASVNFGSSIGWLWFGRISDAQVKLIRGQIQGAKKRGLQARYWSTPNWPIGLRNKVWELLIEEGVGYLNGDDLRGMTRMDWGKKKHWSLLG